MVFKPFTLGYSLVIIENRVPFNRITKWTKIVITKIERVLWYRVTKFTLVKGRTFANTVAHPHPNYMGVPPLGEQSFPYSQPS